MPLVTASWLNDVRAPRIFGGLTSEMYMGLTKDAVPTAIPSSRRKPISIGASTENAQPSAATTYTEPEITLVYLRLMRSAR